VAPEIVRARSQREFQIASSNPDASPSAVNGNGTGTVKERLAFRVTG
jgi:hypothetical protein